MSSFLHIILCIGHLYQWGQKCILKFVLPDPWSFDIASLISLRAWYCQLGLRQSEHDKHKHVWARLNWTHIAFELSSSMVVFGKLCSGIAWHDRGSLILMHVFLSMEAVPWQVAVPPRCCRPSLPAGTKVNTDVFIVNGDDDLQRRTKWCSNKVGHSWGRVVTGCWHDSDNQRKGGRARDHWQKSREERSWSDCINCQ